MQEIVAKGCARNFIGGRCFWIEPNRAGTGWTFSLWSEIPRERTGVRMFFPFDAAYPIETDWDAIHRDGLDYAITFASRARVWLDLDPHALRQNRIRVLCRGRVVR